MYILTIKLFQNIYIYIFKLTNTTKPTGEFPKNTNFESFTVEETFLKCD